MFQAVINSRQMNSVSPRQAPPPAVVHPKGRPEPPPPANIRHQQMGRLNDEINDLERDYEVIFQVNSYSDEIFY